MAGSRYSETLYSSFTEERHMLTIPPKRNCDAEAKVVYTTLKKGLILLKNHTSIRLSLQLDLGISYALSDEKLTDEEVATKAGFVGHYDEYKIYPRDWMDMQDCFVLCNHEVDSTTSVRHYLEGSSLFAKEDHWLN
jgi:hypothetical protein